MAKIKITQVKSSIGSTKRQKLTMEALGLKKCNRLLFTTLLLKLLEWSIK
jgi:large subunit ribosomal protein L30